MRLWVRWRAIGVIVAAAVVLASGEAGAQRRLGLGTWDGALEFGVEGERQRTKSEGSSDTKSDRTRYDERLTVRNTGGFILDPRLWSGSFSGTFGLFQEQERFDGTGASRSGRLLGYSFDSVILAEKPYTVTVFTNRSQNVLSREFGGRSEITFENRGGTFRLREDSFLQDLGIPHFTSVVGARQELTKEDTTVLGQTFKRDEVRTILTYDGSKGFETSDLTLRYEFTDLDDKENPQLAFQSHSAGLTYSLDFGEHLNRRWDSRLNYFTRSGLARNTFLSADEELRIDHYENLFTDYRYLLTRVETDAGATTTHSGTVKGQHRLYRSLTTTLMGQGTFEDLPTGERRIYAGQLDLDYQRSVPWNGRVFAGAGARYQVDDNRFRVSRVDVVDESHTAPSPLGGSNGFTLANAFVIPGTIVVVDTRGGARLPTTLGVDYIVVQEGDFTKIIPLAGSPVILPGDPLAVSYSFEVNPSLKFSTVSWRGNLGVDFQWIAVSFAHEQSDQNVLSGQDGRFLEDRTLDTVRLELRGDWERVRAVASAQYRAQEGNRLAFTSREFGQIVTYRPFLDLMLNLTAQETFTNFTLPRRQGTTFSTRGDATWTPLSGLFISGFASLLTFDESDLPSETIREVGVRIRWTFGKLDVTPTFTRTSRERGAVENTDLRFELKIIRRF